MNFVKSVPPRTSTPGKEHVSYDTLYFVLSCSNVALPLSHKSSKSSMLRGAMSILSSPNGVKVDAVHVVVNLSDVFPHDEENVHQEDIEWKEQFRTEKLRQRDPEFSVGFNVQCPTGLNRHVRFEVILKSDELSTFGYFSTTFRDLDRISITEVEADFPIHSTLVKDASLRLTFIDVSRYKNCIVPSRRQILRFFRQDANMIAVEEAAEVDYCYRVPAMFLNLCLKDLKKNLSLWKEALKKKRILERNFETSEEALHYGCATVRIQVLEARGLMKPSTQPQDVPDSVSVLGRFRTKAGQWASHATTKRDGTLTVENGACNAVVSVRIHVGEGNDIFIGRTNTEYDTNAPLWGSNQNADKWQHSKPNMTFCVGTRVGDVVPNLDHQSSSTFVLYLPRNSQVLDGCLEFHVAHERLSILSGVEHIPMHNVILPLDILHSKLLDGRAQLDQWFSLENCGEIHLVVEMILPLNEKNNIGDLTRNDGRCSWNSPKRGMDGGGEDTTSVSVPGRGLGLSLSSPLLIPDDFEKTVVPRFSSSPNLEDFQREMFPLEDSNGFSLQFLLGHVKTLSKQVEDLTQMIQLFGDLSQQGKSFKSSQHKKRSDIQAAPTNLHISYLRVYRMHYGKESTVGSHMTEDLLGLNGSSEVDSRLSNTRKGNALILQSIHSLVTCGAPTAHALGLKEYGLHTMEILITKKQEELERITGKSYPESFPSPWNNNIRVVEIVPPSNQSSGRTLGAGVHALATFAKATAKAANKKPVISRENYAEVQRLRQELESLKRGYYMRKVVATSQAISALVSCFMTFLELGIQEKSRYSYRLEQIAEIGFLIGWESLISSQGNELHMLADTRVAIRSLKEFSFRLVPASISNEKSNSSNSSSNHHHHHHHHSQEEDKKKGPTIVFEKLESSCVLVVSLHPTYFEQLPSTLQRGNLIAIVPVLFTQGINEMQSLANMVGVSGVQATINANGIHDLKEYFEQFVKLPCSNSIEDIRSALLYLEICIRDASASNKDADILIVAADIVRALNGGRVTFCKSGKDRTAMSVTLEQARISLNCLGKAESMSLKVLYLANLMREFGVRLLIARKNVGRMQYSFNSLQRKMLPEIYRPPTSTIQDIVTSVTARDS